MLSKNTSYIPKLDHLRFFAALLVAAYHFHGGSNIAPTLNPVLAVIREGESGVSLFMILSGFILTRIALGKEIAYRTFLFNRLIRIYPLYLFALFFAIYSGGRHMDLLSVLSMVTTIGVVNGTNLPKMQHIWTIAVEFQFYLLFPFMVRFLGRYGARYVVGFIGLMIVVRGMMFAVDGTISDAAYWTIVGRLDQFAIGMLAAVAYAKYPRLMSSPFALLLAAASVYLWIVAFTDVTGGYYGKESASSPLWIVSPTVEALVWAVLALAYLQQKWALPALADRALCYLGSISFSTYIWHFPIIMALYKFPEGFVFKNAYVDFAVIVMPAIIAVSSLSYFVIEKPFFALRTVYAKPSSVISDRRWFMETPQ